MLLVNCFALGAVGVAQAASDCDSNRDSCGQPDRNVSCEDAGRGADSSAQSNAKADLS